MDRTRNAVLAGLATAVVASVTGGVLAMAPSGSAAAGPPECDRGDLSAAYKEGGAATSHVYGRIVLRNTSDHTCVIQGYGGLSYVGGGDGTQVGAPADRTKGPTPRVVLEPGDRARSRIVETSTGPYSRSQCRPAPVDGFRVYVPDETRSLFIAHETTGCANDAVHLLTHKSYR